MTSHVALDYLVSEPNKDDFDVKNEKFLRQIPKVMCIHTPKVHETMK